MKIRWSPGETSPNPCRRTSGIRDTFPLGGYCTPTPPGERCSGQVHSADIHVRHIGDALRVQKEDPIPLRICDPEAPPVGKDSTHRVLRGEDQLGQILARERDLDGEALDRLAPDRVREPQQQPGQPRSEEHTSELQSRVDLVCRLLLEKKKNTETWTSRD